MAQESLIVRTTKSRWSVFAVASIVVISLIGAAAWSLREPPEDRAERLLSHARALRLAGDDAQAEREAATALELAPTLGDAALIAAECALKRGDFERAVGYLQRSAPDDPKIGLRVARLAAELSHLRLHRLSQAERHYRAALGIDPDDPQANAGLAKLLGLCGRRDEAIPHVLRLIRQGEATDLLILLARESGGINDPEALEAARRADPADPNPLVGLAWREASEERTAEAVELLREATLGRSGNDAARTAAHVALGTQLLAARRFGELVEWEERLPADADEFAETWFVRGRMAEHEGDSDAAIRCYGEAARRAPESKIANYRLAKLLAERGEEEASARFSERLRRLQELERVQDRILFSTGHSSIEPLLELIQSYEAVGRLWEAYGWCQVAVDVDPANVEAGRLFDGLRRKVEGLPLRLTADSANAALSFDLSSYPLPRFRQAPRNTTVATTAAATAISFRDDAASAGLRFRYVNGTEGPPARRMFEFTGGGIGVLDADLDGLADIFFTQGGLWPPGSVAGEGDRLFRNAGGERFDDVTERAGIRENGFGQGVAVGDFDADGFPDLYVAGIGANRLWRNNGDGTFADVTDETGIAGDEWTTSCLMADLDGDGLPDLYDVNYVTGPDVFDRVCVGPDGGPAICMPFDFDEQPDRVWHNTGDGRFVEATTEILSVVPGGKGLGIAAWDADGSGRLSLYVANDTTPSFFFTPPSAGSPRLEERGIASGLALNGEGKATGCMGVALGDADDDGRLDVLVTNFLAEPNTLFMSAGPGVFEDRTREKGLHGPSLDVLGFGTQFLDADLDGRLELFVSNGHIDDLRRHGKPYKMPAQLFRRNGRGFEQVAADELGPYFRDLWLGRAVARLDWNRDGREDLAVGHLETESALLTNTTPEAGRFLSLRLTGVRSNRDAIGTTVEARIGRKTIVRQLTAGDGYQASNERRLVFGAGDAERIDELVVRWPSGTVQRFKDVPMSERMWLAEGRQLLPEP